MRCLMPAAGRSSERRTSSVAARTSGIAPARSEIALFAVLSVVFVYFVRPRFKLPGAEPNNLNQRMYNYIGRSYVLDEAIVNGRGRVRIDDTLWTVTGADRGKGEWVKVKGVDGASLVVEPASGPD